MSVLDWLTGWFSSAASIVAKPIIDLVHWAVHALGSVVLTVFSHVFGAWSQLAGWFEGFFRAFTWLIHAIAHVITEIKRVIIPAVVKYFKVYYHLLYVFAHAVLAWAVAAFKAAEALARLLVRDAIAWVIAHVWNPLKAFADYIWAHLLQWGYVAWWWITHLKELADALIYHLVDSLERNAWDIAGKLGTFALALVVRNLARFIKLAESIIAAVL